MRVLFLIILSLMLNGYSWAYLTAGKIAVTATSSSSGVPSTSQDSDITDTKGSSVAVGVPVAVTGNVNITGNYQVNGTPISATSNWNQSGSTINYTAGNVGVGSISPGTLLDVQGTVRATVFSGSVTNQLGAWSTFTCETSAHGHTLQAATDLFIGVNSATGTPNENVSCITDSSSSPTTVRNSNYYAGGSTAGCSTVVKKNDYYEGYTQSNAGTCYSIPIGS